MVVAEFFFGCGPLNRPYYNRDVGGYYLATPGKTPTATSPYIDDLSSEGKRLKKIVESWLGVGYSFGGQSRSGIDCSGFVRQIFSEAYSIRLPHNSGAMFTMGKSVTKAKLQAGDIVFFKRVGFINHAGVYIGNNYFIHSSTSVGVAYSTLDAPYFSDHYAGARRMSGIN